ncbi:class I tRNA ligase family protein, partial [Patescibacteria group bacterium]|nr:class I tRNA ligase family protein [Patescibacteria group bacterium]
VKGWKKFDGHTPHRPWVDEVKIKCSKCGEIVERIPDVGNPWLDAGIVPYSTIMKNNKGTPLYQKDKKEWRKWFPADFITEAFPGQFKNWFYAMIAESAVLENEPPYKTVLGHALILGEDGREMHKSLGNAIEFNEGADKIGVDVMRWMYVRQDPEHNLLFGYKKADEVRRRFHLKVWNIYNFFITYANVDGWSPIRRGLRPGGEPNNNQKSKINNQSVLDRWIVSRLNQTIKGVTKNLEDYDAYRASEKIEEFVEDLSNWFIRRSRERVGPTAKNKVDKKSFFDTSYFILVSLIKLLAPFTPYLSDVIYRNLTKEDSVHLSDWPEVKGKITKNLITQMKSVREAVELAHAERKSANIPVRQPLNSLVTISPSVTPQTAMLNYFSEELNVKKIDWKKGKTLTVKLDIKLTPELEEEGKARELVRKIQSERRMLGAELTQKVNVSSPWVPSSKEVTKWVLGRTLSVKLEKGKFKITKAS